MQEPEPQAPGLNSEDEVKVEEKEEEDGRHAARRSSCAASQDLCEISLQASQSWQLSMDEPDAGEASSAADTAALRGVHLHTRGMPGPDKEKKEEDSDNMFNEILQATADLDHEHRAWQVNVADSLEKERVEKRKPQSPSRKRRGRCTRT
ncbi:uncharacterized protein ACDP82_005700 [Pangshura tecta]